MVGLFGFGVTFCVYVLLRGFWYVFVFDVMFSLLVGFVGVHGNR